MRRWFPNREEIVRSRWIAPMAHHLEDDRLWNMERGCVARAVAIGLFFGLVLPTAQFILAVGCAIWLRGNVAIAAGATLITNPLTFAPVYWLAHRIGSVLLGRDMSEADEAAAAVRAQTEAAAAAQGWLAAAVDTVLSAGAPLVLGLWVLAVSCSVLGFAAVWLLWRPRYDRPPAQRIDGAADKR